MSMTDTFGSDPFSQDPFLDYDRRRPQRLSSKSSHSGGDQDTEQRPRRVSGGRSHGTEQDKRRPQRVSGSTGHDVEQDKRRPRRKSTARANDIEQDERRQRRASGTGGHDKEHIRQRRRESSGRAQSTERDDRRPRRKSSGRVQNTEQGERRPRRESSGRALNTEQDERRLRRISSRSSHSSGDRDGNYRGSNDRDYRNKHENYRRKKDGRDLGHRESGSDFPGVDEADLGYGDEATDFPGVKTDVADLGYGECGNDFPGVNEADLGYGEGASDFPGVNTANLGYGEGASDFPGVNTADLGYGEGASDFPGRYKVSNSNLQGHSHLMQRTRTRRRASVGGIVNTKNENGIGNRRAGRRVPESKSSEGRQLVRSTSSDAGIQKITNRRAARRASITAIASGAAVENMHGMPAMNQEPQVAGPSEPVKGSRVRENKNRRRHARRSSLGYSRELTENPPANESSEEMVEQHTSAEERLENQKRMMQMFTKKEELVEVPKKEDLGYGDLGNGDLSYGDLGYGDLSYGDLGYQNDEKGGTDITTDEVKDEPLTSQPSLPSPPIQKRERGRRRSLLGNIGSRFSSSSGDEQPDPNLRKEPGRGLVVDRDRHNGSLLERIGTTKKTGGSSSRRLNSDVQERAPRKTSIEDREGFSYSDRIMSMGKA